MIALPAYFNLDCEATSVVESDEVAAVAADATGRHVPAVDATGSRVPAAAAIGSRVSVTTATESVNESCLDDSGMETAGDLSQLMADRDKFGVQWIHGARNLKRPPLNFDPTDYPVSDREQVVETVLDEFLGRVEQVRDGMAHVTLEAADGTIFHGAREVSEFERLGIVSGDRFICRTVKKGPGVSVKILPAVPQDVPIDAINAIDDELADIFDF